MMNKDQEWVNNCELAYFELFNRITEIIEELKQIQQDAEDIMLTGSNELTYKMHYDHFKYD